MIRKHKHYLGVRWYENCRYTEDIKDSFKMKPFEMLGNHLYMTILPLIQNDQGLKEG